MERTRWLVRRERWEAIRKLGWPRYVFIDNMLRFGGMLFVVNALLTNLFGHSVRETLLYAVGYLSVGFIFGVADWWINQRTFSRLNNYSQEPSQ